MPENNKNSKANLDRRSFLKGAGATGAFAVLAPGQSNAQKQTGKTKSWMDKPDPIDEKLIADAGKFDIVVVGAGTAGVLCARVAAMKGASVAVIEAQSEAKYRHIGGEVGTVNSRWARDHGAPEIDEEDFLREWARRNVIRHSPKRARYFAKNSGRIFDWVIKDMSPEWMAENSHLMSLPRKPNVLLEVSGWKFYYGTTIFRKMTDPTPVWRWTEVMKTHQTKSMAEGAQWFFDHHAEICDVDRSGAVTGVVAKTSDGKYFRFHASKAVALCAGDFSANKQMVIDILDLLRHSAEAQGDVNLVQTDVMAMIPRDGSSIKLGIWAGGHIEIGPRSTMGAGDPGAGEWYLQLDSNGERFCDEAAGTAIPVPKGDFIVTLHDANYQKIIEMMPPRHGAVDTAHTLKYPARLKLMAALKPGPPVPKKKAPARDLASIMQNPEAELVMSISNMYCANTIEELLDYMDCYKGDARNKALAEIARYNQLCEKGVDEDFGKDPRILKVTALKDPPFYGSVGKNDGSGILSAISPGLCATTGLDTDADGRVLNKEFKPIKGLYAAGNNAGNRYAVVYQSPIAGISLGMAMTEGYMLGERLASLTLG
jgi:succinate dehydrogenase/fumarate reductase flavoprotein subunit